MIDYVNIPKERLVVLEKGRLRFLRKLRDFFEVDIRVGDDVEIEGEDSMAVLRTKEIVKAFGRGFKFEETLDLVDEDFILDVINTNDYVGKSKHRQREMRARVIGSQGKAKNIIQKYSGAKLAIYGKTVSIIGKWENVRLAREAVELLLSGSKHSTAFRMLEERKIL